MKLLNKLIELTYAEIKDKFIFLTTAPFFEQGGPFRDIFNIHLETKTRVSM